MYYTLFLISAGLFGLFLHIGGLTLFRWEYWAVLGSFMACIFFALQATN